MKRTENTCTQVQVCPSEERLYIYNRGGEKGVCVCGRELWERDRGRWKNKAASLISYRCLDRVAWLAPNSLQAYRPLMSSNYFLFKKVIKKKDELYRKWRMNMGNWAVFRLHFLLSNGLSFSTSTVMKMTHNETLHIQFSLSSSEPTDQITLRNWINPMNHIFSRPNSSGYLYITGWAANGYPLTAGLKIISCTIREAEV